MTSEGMDREPSFLSRATQCAHTHCCRSVVLVFMETRSQVAKQP